MKLPLTGALALACAVALSGCATPTSPQSAKMTEGKAVAGLWASLEAASSATDAAVRVGKLKGPQAGAVANALIKATDAITALDASYRANPTADLNAQIIQAASVVSQVLCVVQPTPGCAPVAAPAN